MPTILYLTALKPAKRARLVRSSFIAYPASLGLSGRCKQEGGGNRGRIRMVIEVNWRSRYDIETTFICFCFSLFPVCF